MPLQITDPDLTLVMDIYGRELKYYAGRLCSCVAENGGRPKIGCGCNLGFWYSEPETIYGIRTNFNYKFTSTPHGRIYDGGAKFTIPKHYQEVEQKAFYRIAQGDIIVVENTQRRDTELLKKGVRDTLYTFDVQVVFAVSQKEKVFELGVDYEVNDRTIVWLPNGDSPADGEDYAVEYACKQQFKVWENGANARGTAEDDLPINLLCVLRRYVETEEVNPLDNFNTQEKLF